MSKHTSKSRLYTRKELEAECNRHFRDGCAYVIELLNNGYKIDDLLSVIQKRKSRDIVDDAINKARSGKI